MPTSGTIKSISGETLTYSSDVSTILSNHKGETVNVEVCNDTCNTYSVNVSDEGKIGIALPVNYWVVLSYENTKITSGFAHLINTVRLIGMKLGDLFSQAQTTGDYTELSNSVSGPVGIYFLIDYFKSFGFLTFLSVMGDYHCHLLL